MREDNKSEFEFTYSVPTERERKEIESIRSGYEEKTAKKSKFEKLQALDRKAKALPKAVAILIGITATLIFGLGMSTVMVWAKTLLGVLICAVGVIGMAGNCFIFKKLSRLTKRKYGTEIIALSNELLKEEKKQ